MGFLDRLLGRKPDKVVEVMQPATTMSGWMPMYQGYNRLQSVWDSDLAWQCIDRIQKEVAKITPCHVIRTPDSLQAVNSDIQRVLRHPNEIMTAYDMASKVIHTLFTRGDAFIYPVYDGNNLDGLYPVIPESGVDFLESGGQLYVRLKFNNGTEYTVPYMAIIHIRLNFGEDEFMGTVRERPLLSNMQINQSLLEGVEKGVNASSLINGVVKYGTAISRNLIEQDVKAFEASLKKSESGILGLDNQSDFREVKRDVKLVDAETLRFVQSLVLNHFGVPQKILDGTASREEREGWYHDCIRPLLECMGQAYGRVLFSRMKQNKGHEICFYNKNRLEWMKGSELNEAIAQLTNVGALQINQILEAYGLPPLGEEGTVRPMSLNYIDSLHATEYQLESVKAKQNIKEDEDDGKNKSKAGDE